MTATAHALIGGAIAASVQNPTIGLPLAAISHPIADMIPHWDFGTEWKKKTKLVLFAQSLFDLIFGVTLTYLFFGQLVDNLYLLLAIFLSEVWDFLQMPYLLWGWKFPFSTFYNFGHEVNSRARLPWGILTQIGTVFGLIFALRFVH